jgi:Fic family protein
MTIKNNLVKLTVLKQKLDKQRPLPSELVKSLQKDYLVKSTYHSNAIEGNTLTIYETKAILEDGITIAGKSMREHLEAINHKQAILLTEDIIKNKEDMSERIIKDLHSIILHGIDNSNAGVYRKSNVIISGASHTPPDYLKVPQLMTDLIEWYNQECDLHPIEKAAILHSKFVNIHPFIDGNGRTSRLLMNLELIKSGFLPIIIEKEKRVQYYEVLDIAAVKTDFGPFIEFVMNYEDKELKRYIKLIKRQKELDDPEL